MSILHVRLGAAFIISLLLTIIPMPELLQGFRPMWLLLLVLYVQLYLSEYFTLLLLLVLGLLLDALLSTVIGEHTFALTLVTWIASTKVRRFCFFSMGQQMSYIAIFGFLYQLVILTIDDCLGLPVALISPFGSTLVSVLLWPWIRLTAEITKLQPKH